MPAKLLKGESGRRSGKKKGNRQRDRQLFNKVACPFFVPIKSACNISQINLITKYGNQILSSLVIFYKLLNMTTGQLPSDVSSRSN